MFWELELLPMFFLISMWGTGRREYSAMKFVLFTFLGSAFMLAANLALYFSQSAADRTFDMTALAGQGVAGGVVPASFIFAGFLIGFAVKLPIFPTAHVAARRPYGRPDGCQRHAGGRAAQDGRVRSPAHQRGTHAG